MLEQTDLMDDDYHFINNKFLNDSRNEEELDRF